MSFPSPSEYDDAIQNLSSAFIDAELKNGKNDGPLRFGVHGTVASGSFAIVYRIKCGSKRYAVKCFTSQPPENQRQRYSNIHDHLSRSKLKCSVGFQYLEEGVRVRGATYPILKMEWIEAPTLLKHLPTQLADCERLGRLADAFLNLTGELRNNKIAHGDLQHGNLLVSGHGLKIIDYDGMCVPGTNGLPSVENGLPPYQHPRRNGGKLNLKLDHFSSLVIWTSLYALSLDSNLWKQHIGDADAERLLFKQSDFINPQDSLIFTKLRTYRDERLAKAVTALYAACLLSDLENIPHIKDVLTECEWWKEEHQKQSRKKRHLPDWIVQEEITGEWQETTQDNSKHTQTPTTAIRNDTEQKLALTQASRVDYGKAVFLAQACVALVICSSILQGFLQVTHGQASLGLLAPIISLHIAGGVILEYCMYFYSTYEICERITKMNSDYSELVTKTAILRKQLETVKSNILSNNKRVQEVAEMKQKLESHQKQHKIRLANLDEEFKLPTTKIEADLKQIDCSEVAELNDLKSKHIHKVGQIKQRIDSINTDRQSQITVFDEKTAKIKYETEALIESRRLEKFKKVSLEVSAPIRSGAIEGWFVSVKKLHQAGIHNASDIFEVPDYAGCLVCIRTDGVRVKIPGIGRNMAENLQAWLKNVRNKSRLSRTLVELDPDELRRIREDESKKKSALAEIKKSIEEQYAVDEKKELKETHTQEERFKERQAAIKRQFEIQRDELERRKTDCKGLYRDKYKLALESIDDSINELTENISRRERLIVSGTTNGESSKKIIAQELAVNMQNIELLELKIRTHHEVSFGHFLRGVFS